jgi:hypothetical protein
MVPDETWVVHQRALALLNKMADHPETGIAFKKMAKKVDGSLQFADLEMAERVQAPVMEKLSAAEARIAAMEAEREAEKLSRQQEKVLQGLQGDVEKAASAFGLSDEGRKKMTARMQDKGNLDAEAAAAWVASQTPKSKPSAATGAFAPTALNPWGAAKKSDEFAGLHTDPVDWMGQEIEKILEETNLAA